MSGINSDWWLPLSGRTGLGYHDIVEAIHTAVVQGALRPGERLPPQRELAKSLGVAVPTVSRAYREAGSRGLILSVVGRGTVVRGEVQGRAAESGSEIDLSENSVLPESNRDELADGIRRLAAAPELSSLFGFLPVAGHPHDREVFARALRDRGLAVPSERVLLTAGGQHGILLAVAGLVPPGQRLLVAESTCYGIHNVARHLGVGLVGVEMDAEGIVPEALAEAAAASGARVAYIMPTMQNPTGRTMSTRRRDQLLEVASEKQLHLIEDDAYGFLSDIPAVASRTQEPLVTYLSSVGKMLWPGVRIGLLVAPTAVQGRKMEGAIAASVQQATGFTARLAADAVEGGLCERMVADKRRALGVRGAEARSILGGAVEGGDPLSPHLWVALAEPWTDAEFTAALRTSGVIVSPGSDFSAVAARTVRTVRVCLGSTADPHRLRKGLQIVRELLDEPSPLPRVVGT